MQEKNSKKYGKWREKNLFLWQKGQVPINNKIHTAKELKNTFYFCNAWNEICSTKYEYDKRNVLPSTRIILFPYFINMMWWFHAKIIGRFNQNDRMIYHILWTTIIINWNELWYDGENLIEHKTISKSICIQCAYFIQFGFSVNILVLLERYVE